MVVEFQTAQRRCTREEKFTADQKDPWLTLLLHASQAGKEAFFMEQLEAKANVNSTDKVRRKLVGI